MRMLLWAWVAFYAIHAEADVLLSFDSKELKSNPKTERAGQPTKKAWVQSRLARALANDLNRPVSEAHRSLLAEVSNKIAQSDGDVTVWLGQVAGADGVDAILVRNWLPYELHFGDGQPPVTNGRAMFEGCETSNAEPCSVEVVPIPSKVSARRDVYVRAARGCYLFYSLGDYDPMQLGAVPCSNTFSKVVADRDSCLSSGGKLVPAFMRGSLVCVRPTKDAGRACTDAEQCEGKCIPPIGAKPGESVTGMCSATSGGQAGNFAVQKGVARLGPAVD